MIAVAGERLGAALLAVDDRDDGGDFETSLLGAPNRLEGRAAGGDDVLEDDDARALGDVVLDAALGAVVLRFLADQEAPQGVQRGAGAAPGALDGALPGEAGDVTDDRVGAMVGPPMASIGRPSRRARSSMRSRSNPAMRWIPSGSRVTRLQSKNTFERWPEARTKSPWITHFSAMSALSLSRSSTGTLRNRLL